MTSPEWGIKARLAVWQEIMDIPGVRVEVEQIDTGQIDDQEGQGMTELTGITFDPTRQEAILFHTGPAKRLTEDEVVHELVHVLRPEWSDTEDHHLIDEETDRWLEQIGTQRFAQVVARHVPQAPSLNQGVAPFRRQGVAPLL